MFASPFVLSLFRGTMDALFCRFLLAARSGPKEGKRAKRAIRANIMATPRQARGQRGAVGRGGCAAEKFAVCLRFRSGGDELQAGRPQVAIRLLPRIYAHQRREAALLFFFFFGLRFNGGRISRTKFRFLSLDFRFFHAQL